MLSEPSVKRHLIFLPPPPFFRKMGGGSSIFWLKSSIFDFGRDKKFWRDFGIERNFSATNRPIIGPILATNPQLKFQKYGFFDYYEANLGSFFFKI